MEPVRDGQDAPRVEVARRHGRDTIPPFRRPGAHELRASPLARPTGTLSAGQSSVSATPPEKPVDSERSLEQQRFSEFPPASPPRAAPVWPNAAPSSAASPAVKGPRPHRSGSAPGLAAQRRGILLRSPLCCRALRCAAACFGIVPAAARIAADDDQGRERLVRYCSRPAFALDRIELLPHGRIAYLLKTPWRGRTHCVMSPMELLARLAALIPPPRPRASELALAAPNGSTRARSSVGVDGVRVRRGVGGHPARARHGNARRGRRARAAPNARRAGPATGRAGV
ncbi:transposase [Sorangium sp. So ce426]|uniref:transposase n=1 Tax=unclassified Sorangium TaxID=2621164 RepID=UPI003F5B5CAB